MQRSRKRKLARQSLSSLRVPLASAVLLAGMPVAYAQQDQAGANEGLEEIIVTAQKRSENLQTVPISIQALGTQKLEEMNVASFNDYAQLLPSVSFVSIGPGSANVYFRGVASGENANHSGPLPTVGMYLDEQPITTIQGSLDVHIYDIARVEALAGPQGTLYGASSLAGTIRLITNKPEIGEFKGGYGIEANTLSGDVGYVGEGFLNLPISDAVAARIVAWKRHDAGYIDNVARTRDFPTWGGSISNAALAEDNYNDVDTIGARAALKIDLNDDWTITPTVMGQKQESNGTFSFAEFRPGSTPQDSGFSEAFGENETATYRPNFTDDKWMQTTLTVEGKIGNLDVVYAGAYLKRDVEGQSDYNDYAFFYDANYSYTFAGDSGDPIDPSQYFQSKDGFQKSSHELRFSTPQDARLRFVGGAFLQRQRHNIQQVYKIDNLGTDSEVTNYADTIWLTQQVRVDRDSAFFGELSFDATDKLTLTGGIRFFKADNTLKGYFGYGSNDDLPPDPGNSRACFEFVEFRGAPCINLDKRVKEDGNIIKFTASYQFDEDRMMYATYSEGFRPGGINRRGDLPPYTSDFLKNYEVGWKSSWFDNRLRVNGAVFWEEWEDFQFSFTGPNGLTVIANAGSARIKGLEMDASWAATDRFRVSAGFMFVDAALSQDYCDQLGVTSCPGEELAPKGARLPTSPKLKANLSGRYESTYGEYDIFAQGSLVHQTSVWADLKTGDRDVIGEQPGYTLVDFSTGFGKNGWGIELSARNLFDKRAEITRGAQCASGVCDTLHYVYMNQPRTIALKFSQKF
jgi:iron complex outermembrane recepter protein